MTKYQDWRGQFRARWAELRSYGEEHEFARRWAQVIPLLGFSIVCGLVVAGIWVLWVVPQWQVDRSLDLALRADGVRRLEVEDELRKTLTQIVLGVFGLILLYFTWRRARAGDTTVRIMEQGHITDRFTKAVEQLGKVDGERPNIEVRLGAIYALERIALDSARDHWTVMEVLTAYVRQNAPMPAEGTSWPAIRTDIQAILKVLGRRRLGPRRERPGDKLDLRSTCLFGADLQKARLRGVILSKAILQGAVLSGADLQEAVLQQADLQSATLAGANLSRANLNGTHLQKATLLKANLQQAQLLEADLQNALLSGANLEGADLTAANLQAAQLGEANLQHARFSRANLQHAYLHNANLDGARLNEANLEHAHVWSAQLKATRRWERARYSPELRSRLGLPAEPGADVISSKSDAEQS